MLEIFGEIWGTVFIRPMINSLVLLYSLLYSNFGLSIIAFTVIIRVIMFPLTVKQSRMIKKMGGLQPELQKLQARYKDDKSRLSQETMQLYRAHGVNPIGCLGPMFIQFPIWIGLYQAVLKTLPTTPESLVGLSGNLYGWLPKVHSTIPIDSSFLWLDLAIPDSTPTLPILVGASMFLMQKMSTMPAADPRQESTNRLMLWMMPVMFGFFTFQFPAGLALYWIVSNVVGIIMQGVVTGFGPLTSMMAPVAALLGRRRGGESPDGSVAALPAETAPAEEEDDEADRDASANGGRSNRNRSKGARRRSKRGRNRRR